MAVVGDGHGVVRSAPLPAVVDQPGFTHTSRRRNAFPLRAFAVAGGNRSVTKNAPGIRAEGASFVLRSPPGGVGTPSDDAVVIAPLPQTWFRCPLHR